MRVERPLVRVNWLLHSDPELFLPLGRAEKRVPRAYAEGPLYLRTERQTLVRLPRTQAVAFGIKTSVTPIEALEPQIALGLRDALGDLDRGTLGYRAGTDMIGYAMGELDRIACGTG